MPANPAPLPPASAARLSELLRHHLLDTSLLDLLASSQDHITVAGSFALACLSPEATWCPRDVDMVCSDSLFPRLQTWLASNEWIQSGENRSGRNEWQREGKLEQVLYVLHRFGKAGKTVDVVRVIENKTALDHIATFHSVHPMCGIGSTVWAADRRAVAKHITAVNNVPAKSLAASYAPALDKAEERGFQYLRRSDGTLETLQSLHLHRADWEGLTGDELVDLRERCGVAYKLPI